MKRLILIFVVLLIGIPAIFIGKQFMPEKDIDAPAMPVANAAEQVLRGQYLARAGDCMACHTTRGGTPYAGGRAIATPFGNIHSPNITPDVATGIGSWSANDFWRALHHGKSKDGSFLYPAFPYTNYTKVSRADSDALHAYFRTLPAVQQANRPHALRFPYNQRMLLAVWRALYFKPGVYAPDTTQSVDWNRGAYLVQGLGHCSACHSNRNVLGATGIKGDLGGGLIPVLNWYAPSLTSDAETGLGSWEVQDIADLLKTGVSARSTVFGPMAEVVRESLQHMSDADIHAMAGYLKTLPQTAAGQASGSVRTQGQGSEQVLKLGAALYEKHCAECHKAGGEGVPPAYPPLAGNRAITMPAAINSIRMVLNGGFPPSTGGNPRPYGMPPFATELNDEEVAAVVSYIRSSWGNQGALVSAVEVGRSRAVPLD
ncbi:MAG: cytochrome c [Pseudomonadota bacterium]